MGCLFCLVTGAQQRMLPLPDCSGYDQLRHQPVPHTRERDLNPQKKPESQGILLIRPTLKIAGGFIAVCRIDPELNETEVRQLDVTGAPDHEWPGLFKLIEKQLVQGRRQFILDLQKVPWMNSRGLGRLIEMWKLIGDAGGQAVLVCAPGRILTILEISQVSLIMNPVLTLNEAVQVLGEKAS